MYLTDLYSYHISKCKEAVINVSVTLVERQLSTKGGHNPNKPTCPLLLSPPPPPPFKKTNLTDGARVGTQTLNAKKSG